MITPRQVLLIALALSMTAPSCRGGTGRNAADPGRDGAENEVSDAVASVEAAGTVHDQAANFFAGQPEYFRPLADTPPPEGLGAMDSATCGACHVDQLAEWRDSIHARAWDDDQYQAELAKDPAIRWICINCHLPLFDQQAQLPVGLTNGELRQPIQADNPTYDAVLRDDAIGCAACHVREGWVEGPTGLSPGAPHRTREGAGLREPAFCTRCHGVEVVVDELDLVCAFATGREWEAWRSSRPEGTPTRCQDCHMPTVEHRRWSGAAPAPGRHHAFPGSLIPKRPADREAFEALQAIFPEGVEVDLSVRPETPAANSEASVRVTLTNARAGHSVPTGDPERYLEVRTTVTGPHGTTLTEQVDVIRARYEWHPKPKLLSDNRLAAGEQRALTVPFTAPDGGAVQVSVQVDKYRIDEHALAYHHLEGVVVPGRMSSRTEVSVAIAPAVGR